MIKWHRIIRFIAQIAVVGLILKALRGPVHWERGRSGPQ